MLDGVTKSLRHGHLFVEVQNLAACLFVGFIALYWSVKWIILKVSPEVDQNNKKFFLTLGVLK